jgi:hypothetical protein
MSKVLSSNCGFWLSERTEQQRIWNEVTKLETYINV